MWILVILITFIIFIKINIYITQTRSKKQKEKIIKSWGKTKEDTYFDFFLVTRYFHNNKHKEKAYHIISEITSIDLNLNDVFKLIDRTSSKIGQQYLYYKIRTIGQFENVRKYSLLSQYYIKDSELRVQCQLILSKLNSIDSYYLEKLMHDEVIKKPKYFPLIYVLAISSILSLVLSIFNIKFLVILFSIFVFNIFFHYKNKENISKYKTSVNQLSHAIIVGNKLANIEEVKCHFDDLIFLEKVKKIHNKAKFIGFEKQLSNEYVTLIWFMIELIKILFLIEYIFFFSFINSITKDAKYIDQLFQFIGEVDVAISIASLKSGNITISEPVFCESKQIIAEAIIHPLIDNCVPNDLLLANSSLLLTGSNMSGKSTFIRTIAINSIVAQTLNICFAKSYTVPYFKIFSSINVSDNLLEDTSYYLKEVLIIKQHIEASDINSNNPCLFILDEIFKGTNTAERIAAGVAVLSFLNRKKHIAIASTHDLEISDLLVNENYDTYHFCENIENKTLNFDYKLKRGKLKTKNAIKILELYHYPPDIINDALEIVKNRNTINLV